MNCSEWVPLKKQKVGEWLAGAGIGEYSGDGGWGPGVGRIDGYWVSFEVVKLF